MKKILTFLVFLSAISLWGQNLVLNPSFENVNVNCSGFGGAGFSNLISWDNPDPTDTCSTPDWFSTCLSSFFPTAAPNSWLGTQAPRTGDAYAGIILYEALSDSYREYIEGTLASPLVAGQSYCVSFYISLADTVPYAVNNIGVHFSPTFVQFPVSHCDVTAPLPVTPQLVYTGATLLDDQNWVRLEWQYTATGGEQYFVIGNFNPNASTNVVNSGGSSFINPFAYYFIDDVSVVGGVCCDAGILPVADFCPNANPANLTANTQGGTWSGTGITSASVGTFDPVVAGLGTYPITYTLPCGASSTVNVTVKNCIEVCIDANGNLTASGGTAPYSWQEDSVTQDCSACLIGCIFPPGCAVNVTTWQTFATGTTISAPASFPIQVIDANGQTVIVNDTANLPLCTCSFNLAVVTNNPATCGNANGSVSITASSGASPYTYSWNNGQTSATATNLSAGNYTCTATDANGCESVLAVTVANNTPLVATIAVTNVACANDKTGKLEVTVTNGTSPYTYSWNTGQTAATLNNLQAGTYICFIQDATGCGTTITGTVSQPPLLQVVGTTTPNTSGNNGTATANVTGGTPPYTFSWQTNPVQYQQTITGLSNGTYTCVVHDASGCAKNVVVTISTTSINEALQAGIKQLSLSPNPSQGELMLSLQLLQPDALNIYLQDAVGKEIWAVQSEKNSQHTRLFSLNTLPKGIYFLTVQTSQGRVTEKVVLE